MTHWHRQYFTHEWARPTQIKRTQFCAQLRFWPIVTGDNGFRQKSGILKIQFFIESRCPPPKLSNDIKYLYSPVLDMRIKSKNQHIFLCLSLAKFRENGHVRFCFLTKDNVSAAMRHVRGENHPSVRQCQSKFSSASSNHSAFLLVHWYNKSFRVPSSDFGVRSRNLHLSFPRFVYRLRHSRWRYERRSSAVLQCAVVLPITF